MATLSSDEMKRFAEAKKLLQQSGKAKPTFKQILDKMKTLMKTANNPQTAGNDNNSLLKNIGHGAVGGIPLGAAVGGGFGVAEELLRKAPSNGMGFRVVPGGVSLLNSPMAMHPSGFRLSDPSKLSRVLQAGLRGGRNWAMLGAPLGAVSGLLAYLTSKKKPESQGTGPNNSVPAKAASVSTAISAAGNKAQEGLSAIGSKLNGLNTPRNRALLLAGLLGAGGGALTGGALGGLGDMVLPSRIEYDTQGNPKRKSRMKNLAGSGALVGAGLGLGTGLGVRLHDAVQKGTRKPVAIQDRILGEASKSASVNPYDKVIKDIADHFSTRYHIQHMKD